MISTNQDQKKQVHWRKNGQNTSSRRLNDFWNKWKKDNAEKQR